MIYKERLKQVREDKNINQIETAKILNISNSAYERYENEHDTFPINHLIKICDYFNVSLDYLFGFTDIPNYKNIHEITKEKAILRLKEFRKENKLTQVKLASILNVANGTIANYECGRNLIATPFLYEICKKYKVSADYLIGRIDKQ